MNMDVFPFVCVLFNFFHQDTNSMSYTWYINFSLPWLKLLLYILLFFMLLQMRLLSLLLLQKVYCPCIGIQLSFACWFCTLKLLNLFISSNGFWWSHWEFLYIISHYQQIETLYFFLSGLDTLYFLLWLWCFSTILNRSDAGGNFCLVPVLRGKFFKLSLLSLAKICHFPLSFKNYQLSFINIPHCLSVLCLFLLWSLLYPSFC